VIGSFFLKLYWQQINLPLLDSLKKVIMAKSLNAKKTAKKEPLKTAKEKKEEKRDKKNSPKRD
jgi:hypothetical protein